MHVACQTPWRLEKPASLACYPQDLSVPPVALLGVGNAMCGSMLFAIMDIGELLSMTSTPCDNVSCFALKRRRFSLAYMSLWGLCKHCVHPRLESHGMGPVWDIGQRELGALALVPRVARRVH